jgi:transposase-like protein
MPELPTGDEMRGRKLMMVVCAVRELTRSRRRELIRQLQTLQAGEEVDAIVEERLEALRMYPHCRGRGMHSVRNGTARGLQRNLCRGCGKTFNALTGTPLAPLRYRDRLLGQPQALIDGLSITNAAQKLEVARNTGFRWRHRFLGLPHQGKAGRLNGIVEADETCFLKSCKGQPARRRALKRPPRARGGRASKRGMSREYDVVLVARDRSGGCTDQIVQALDTVHLAVVLQPVLAEDAVLCTDGTGGAGRPRSRHRHDHLGHCELDTAGASCWQTRDWQSWSASWQYRHGLSLVATAKRQARQRFPKLNASS